MGGTSRIHTPWQGKSRQLVGLGATLLGVVALLAALGLGFASIRSAHANSYDVCASGCTYTSIQAALNAATAGATITVGPGTYNETLTITQAVTLQGANVGVDGTSGSRGAESIIDAGGSATPTITVNASGANVVIDGFEITGSHTEGVTAPGVGDLNIQNNVITRNYNGIFELTATSVVIQHNLIRDNTANSAGHTSNCFHNSPYCNGIFAGASFTSMVIVYNTIDETYTGPADITTNFQRALSIDPTPMGNITVEHNSFVGSSTLGNLNGDFSNNVYTGGLFAVRLVGNMTNFTITHNQFSGLLSNAVITQNSFGGTNTNLTIAANTVNQDVSLLYPGQVVNGADVAAFDLAYVGGDTTIASNTVTFTGTYNGSGVTAVHAIRLRSTAGGTIDITGNTLDGSGVGGTGTSGLQIDSGSVAPTITSNIIRRFSDGVYDTSAQTYSSVGGNCISGNSANGYDATGGAVTAHGNWWGSALGPGTGIGDGNPVTTTTVDASSFLTTAPSSTCAGPVASNVRSSVSPLATQNKYAVLASLSTTTTSTGAVHAAYYTLDGGAPKPMTTASGTFDHSTAVQVTSGTLAAFSSPGTHTICVFGTDVYGQTGSATCSRFTVSIATGLSGQGNPPSAPQTAQNPSTSGATTGASANGSGSASKAPATSAQPKPVAAAITQPGGGVPLWLVVLLAIFGFMAVSGGTVLLMRGRAR